MIFFLLLNKLPADIVHLIYLIILKDSYATKISKFIKIRTKKKNIINEVIKGILNYNQTYPSEKYIISEENIHNLKFLLANDFSRKYSKFFWQNLLGALARFLMDIYTHICIADNKYNNNIFY